MSAPAGGSIPRAPTASARDFLVTFGIIFLLMAVLLALDLFLARVERNQARERASKLYDDGRALLAAGETRKAAELLSTAVALDRSNVRYALAHAQATLAQGRAEDAERMLTSLLERAQNDGAVNLAMARLLVAGGRPSEAKAFYHRAIYGRWGSDSTARRNAARFELIGVLDIEGAHEEMLAELLPLQSDSADTVALLSRVGPLYLRADAPGRAAEAFRALIRRSPDDARAWTGLGDAAIALGQFITARSAFRNAARVAPDDTVIAHRQRLADTLLALDPMARGLSDSERLERSQSLLARTLATIDECASSEFAPDTRAMRDTVIAELAVRVRPREYARATERKLALATSFWRSRPPACAPRRDERTEALHLLQQTLTR